MFKAGYASSHRRRQDGQPDGAILLQRQVDADCLQRRVGKERGDSYIYLNSNIKTSPFLCLVFGKYSLPRILNSKFGFSNLLLFSLLSSPLQVPSVLHLPLRHRHQLQLVGWGPAKGILDKPGVRVENGFFVNSEL